MDGAISAEGDERRLSSVAAALERDGTEAAKHHGVCDAVNSECGLLEVKLETSPAM